MTSTCLCWTTKEQRGKEVAALETVKAEKESQVGSRSGGSRNWPQQKKHGAAGGGLLADPRGRFYRRPGHWRAPKPTGRKRQTPAGENRQGAALLYRAYIDLKGKFERLQGTMAGCGRATPACLTACRR